MSEVNKRTLAARGHQVKYKRGEVQVAVRMSEDLHAVLKQVAIENCRSISQECALRIRRSLKAQEAT